MSRPSFSTRLVVLLQRLALMTGNTPVGAGTTEPPRKAGVLARACVALSAGDAEAAQDIINTDCPLVIGTAGQREYTLTQKLRIFYRDGFLDRYSGDRLAHPGALWTLSMLLPKQFDAHSNGKMTETHFAHWELFPSIDHVDPVAQITPLTGSPPRCCATLPRRIGR
ncbi:MULTISPECIES: hypothetical protein [unclassified Rhodococcus (in: high G+C Gram-positive bacteria)]|uniref:hypothetical protein n=1 Tax=unclassified Rhodococcus (in: high G+C Gram-positive bacteria) TaxID=192944 RepID=UPI0019102ED6|nr:MULTISPECIES: hypothetical protein [unclassified Rhodococcus (in: high G+C Gram-positive bacteria)]